MNSIQKTLNGVIGQSVRSGRAVLGGAAIVLAGLLGGTGAEAAEAAFIKSSIASPPPSGARELCHQYSWACAASPKTSRPVHQEMSLVKKINRKVNASIREVTDLSQYKTQERWALPTRRGGDCEDFALLKKRDLINAGIDPSKLLLATVLDTRRNAHAVLVYRSSQGDLVLDNLTNRIKPWTATKYMFLRMQDPKQPKNWVGVYARS